jgi:hypothetical protein
MAEHHPFKSDYGEGPSTPVADTGEKKSPTAALSEQPPFIKEGTQTPPVGKPYGLGKPRRVIIRGKISSG